MVTEEQMKHPELLDHFDRSLGSLHGIPDVASTKASVIRTVPLFGVGTHLYIVQTFRKLGEGDTIFLEHVSGEKTERIVIPTAVSETIARQRDMLTKKTRSRAAQLRADDLKARGIKPGFMKNR